MQVVRAEALGMCFGVRDALRTIERIADPAEVTIRGELVHNETVLADLDRRGFKRTPEGDRERIPGTPKVLVTAHGTSDRERRRLEMAGKEVVDTTCPLVRRAHEAAKKLAAEDRHVVVVGRPGHVEIRGLTGDLDAFSVVPGPDAARRLDVDRIGVLFQTTTEPEHALRTAVAIRRANPHASIRVIDTICRPTKERQQALLRLLDRVDVLVVVGGRNSNNTRALVRRAVARAVPVLRVAEASELVPRWFRGVRVAGLTAGTSTPPERVDEVEAALRALARGRPSAPSLPARIGSRPAIA